MNDLYLVKAVKKLKPNAEFSFTNNDYSTIKWDILEGAAPTLDEIKQTIEQIKIEETKEEIEKEAKKQALLDKLGITEEEAKLLLS